MYYYNTNDREKNVGGWFHVLDQKKCLQRYLRTWNKWTMASVCKKKKYSVCWNWYDCFEKFDWISMDWHLKAGESYEEWSNFSTIYVGTFPLKKSRIHAKFLLKRRQFAVFLQFSVWMTMASDAWDLQLLIEIDTNVL